MLYNHFTEDLLGLQEVKITNVEKEEENLIIKFFINSPTYAIISNHEIL